MSDFLTLAMLIVCNGGILALIFIAIVQPLPADTRKRKGDNNSHISTTWQSQKEVRSKEV